MSKYAVDYTSLFRKEYKRAIKLVKDITKLDRIITKLANGDKIGNSHRDHELKGEFQGYRECHIEPDWLLIYGFNDEKLLLVLMRTGTHSDLFGK